MESTTKLQSFKSPSTETYLTDDKHGFSITVNTWSSMEGVNLMIHGKDLALRMSGSLTWEEVDALLAALSLARTA